MTIDLTKTYKEIAEDVVDLGEGLLHHKEIPVSKFNKGKFLVSACLLVHGLMAVQPEEIAAAAVPLGEVLHEYKVGGHKWHQLHPNTHEQYRNVRNFIQNPETIGELDFYQSTPTPV